MSDFVRHIDPETAAALGAFVAGAFAAVALAIRGGLSMRSGAMQPRPDHQGEVRVVLDRIGEDLEELRVDLARLAALDEELRSMRETVQRIEVTARELRAWAAAAGRDGWGH